ncbi:hypothetical protein C8J56DRAFT_1046242 [Mycena floridula]|nr:hypothetical protein C8J56DRAFT_1046242 [Mycena floridula]
MSHHVTHVTALPIISNVMHSNHIIFKMLVGRADAAPVMLFISLRPVLLTSIMPLWSKPLVVLGPSSACGNVCSSPTSELAIEAVKHCALIGLTGSAVTKEFDDYGEMAEISTATTIIILPIRP